LAVLCRRLVDALPSVRAYGGSLYRTLFYCADLIWRRVGGILVPRQTPARSHYLQKPREQGSAAQGNRRRRHQDGAGCSCSDQDWNRLPALPTGAGAKWKNPPSVVPWGRGAGLDPV